MATTRLDQIHAQLKRAVVYYTKHVDCDCKRCISAYLDASRGVPWARHFRGMHANHIHTVHGQLMEFPPCPSCPKCNCGVGDHIPIQG